MNTSGYEKLKKLLEENKVWPMLYMFKFIVPNSNDKVKTVVSLLPAGSEISYKHTENLKFVSVTCKVLMPSAESIIEITHRVGTVEGVISL